MKWSIVAVGRVKETFYQQAISQYLDRLRHYRPIQLVEIPEEKLVAGREAQVMAKEALRLEAALPSGLRVALTERGQPLDTAALSAKLMAAEGQGHAGVSFILGGPQGLDPRLLGACDWQLALSPLTFPYQLARLILVEQLYRCETLRRGEPYHKA